MNIISVINQKGGAGKTTVSVNLASTLANQGFRVLIVDLDSQGHSSIWLNGSANGCSTKELFTDSPAEPTELRANLWILTADRRLVKFVNGSLDQFAKSMKRQLQELHDRLKLDVILLDHPADIGTVTLAGLAIADRLLIPITLDFLNWITTVRLLETLKEIRKTTGVQFHAVTLIPNQAHYRAKLPITVQKKALELIRELKAEDSSIHWTITPPIHQSIDLTEAIGTRKTVIDFRESHKSRLDFEYLAAAITEKG